MEINQLEDRTAGIVAYPVARETYEVSFDRGVLPKFAKLFVSQVNMKLESRGSTLSLDEELFQKYLNTLLYNRVQVARYERTSNSKNVLKRVLIPSIFQLALSQIGEVQDRDTLQKFIPVMEKPDFLLNDEELLRLSDTLGIVADFGFELNAGFKFEAEGNLHFMTWSLVDGNFFREDNKSPKAFGILQAFFEIQQMDNVIRPRICYGMKTYYDDLLHALIVDSARR